MEMDIVGATGNIIIINYPILKVPKMETDSSEDRRSAGGFADDALDQPLGPLGES